MLAWLSVWSEVQTCIWPSWCHCHSLSLASVKSRLILPFWYRPTWVVPDKGPLNGCVCVCVCLSVFSCTVLFVSISQVIGCEDRLRNDLYCVKWGVKLYSNQIRQSSAWFEGIFLLFQMRVHCTCYYSLLDTLQRMFWCCSAADICWLQNTLSHYQCWCCCFTDSYVVTD